MLCNVIEQGRVFMKIIIIQHKFRKNANVTGLPSKEVQSKLKKI